MTNPLQEAFFLDTGAPDKARCFAIHHRPAGRVRGVMVFLPPWAEEMNKCRRMVAQQAVQLASCGWAVLLLDPYGCGDSEGEFHEASWTRWLDDASAAVAWIRQVHGAVLPCWLWGLRVGALLASQLAARLPQCDGLLLWQPTLQGRTALQQFLRLRSAGALIAGASSGKTVQLREQLRAEGVLEVAGYVLPEALAAGLEQASVRVPSAPCALVWIESSSSDPEALSPVSQRITQQWREAGGRVHAQVVTGPAFWQTTEIEDAPAWLAATLAGLGQFDAPVHDIPAGFHKESSVATKVTTSTSRTGRRGWHEFPLPIYCEGSELIGIISMPVAPQESPPKVVSRTGVVIIVGGPQYRVGSHRQFVALARHLASAGIASVRFDVRGMGDSPGRQRTFQDIALDIGATVDQFLRAVPDIRNVVLWGLCDGASAALLYIHQRNDPRVSGVSLVNPWVRSAAGLARVQLRHYYLRRVLDLDFWRKLLTGGVGLAAFGGLFESIWLSVRRRPVSSPNGTLSASRNAGSHLENDFRVKMSSAAKSFRGSVLLVLSGQDLTAQEFMNYAEINGDWREVMTRASSTKIAMPHADHTFSNTIQQADLFKEVANWAGGL